MMLLLNKLSKYAIQVFHFALKSLVCVWDNQFSPPFTVWLSKKIMNHHYLAIQYQTLGFIIQKTIFQRDFALIQTAIQSNQRARDGKVLKIHIVFVAATPNCNNHKIKDNNITKFSRVFRIHIAGDVMMFKCSISDYDVVKRWNTAIRHRHKMGNENFILPILQHFIQYAAKNPGRKQKNQSWTQDWFETAK